MKSFLVCNQGTVQEEAGEEGAPGAELSPEAELNPLCGYRGREAEGCYLLPELKSVSIIQHDVVLHRHRHNLIPRRHQHALGETALARLLLQREGRGLAVHTGGCGNFPDFQDA